MINPNITTVLEAAVQDRCTVPDEALAAHRALGRMREVRRSAQVGTATATRAPEVPVDKLLEDLAAGTKLTPDYFTTIHQDVLEAERLRTLASLIDQAEHVAKMNVESLVQSHIEAIVGSLTPRLEQLVDEARGVVEQLGSTERTEAAVVRAADNRVRKAWLELDTLGERYAAMRSLHTTLLSVDGSGVGGPRLQVFGVIRDVPTHWPDWAPSTPEAVPWPTDPSKLLLWCVDHQAQPWMPSPRQLDRAIADAAAARRDEQFATTTGGSA